MCRSTGMQARLLYIAFFCLLAPLPAPGADCSQVFASLKPLQQAAAPVRPAFKPSFQKLFDAGKWLSANAHKVDPKTTHLEPLIPTVLEVQEKIGKALLTKVGEKDYAARAPLLRAVMKEIEQRVADKKVTYEWIAGLPYRIGFLLKMDGTKPMFLRTGFDSPFMFDVQSYATHENFLELLNKAVQEAATKQGAASSLANLAAALRNFPQQRMIPYFSGLNVRELNHLVADEIWPIGITAKSKYVDSQLHDEFAFPMHDQAHASLRYSHLYKEQIPPTLINTIEKETLRLIETSTLKEQDFNVQQYLHFVLFHEGMATDFTLMKNGKWTVELTRETMKEGVTNSLQQADESFLLTRSEGLPHLYDDLRKVAKFANEEEAQASIRRNLADYLSRVEAAVDLKMPAQ